MDNSQNDSMFVNIEKIPWLFIVFEAFEKKRAKRWLPPASETGPGRLDPSVDEDSGGGDWRIEAESALHWDTAGEVPGGKRQPQGQGQWLEQRDWEGAGDTLQAGAVLSAVGKADRRNAKEDRCIHQWAEGCHGEEQVQGWHLHDWDQSEGGGARSDQGSAYE